MTKQMKRNLTAAAIIAGGLAGALLATPASADVVTFNFNPANTFSGTAPAGSLTATFSDVGANHVQLVLTSSLAAGENLDPSNAFYFNLDPADTALLSGGLTFALTNNTGFSQAAVVNTGEDMFKPDGDGLMDIQFTYTPSTKAFTTGESQTYLITGAGLNADDFLFQSTCTTGCGTGAHYAAVHVQNTPSGGNGSAWVGGTPGGTPVPEPASLALLGSGLLGLGLIRRWRRKV